VMTKSKFYIPIFVLFFVRTSPATSAHLKAFDRMRQDFIELSSNVRFALFEINSTNSYGNASCRKWILRYIICCILPVIEEYLTNAFSSPPFTVFFDSVWLKTTGMLIISREGL
jgi:hypothetical protein